MNRRLLRDEQNILSSSMNADTGRFWRLRQACIGTTYDPYFFQLHILFVMSNVQGVQYSFKFPRMIENKITVRISNVSPIIHPKDFAISSRWHQGAGNLFSHCLFTPRVGLLCWNQVVFVIRN